MKKEKRGFLLKILNNIIITNRLLIWKLFILFNYLTKIVALIKIFYLKIYRNSNL